MPDGGCVRRLVGRINMGLVGRMVGRSEGGCREVGREDKFEISREDGREVRGRL